MKFKYNNRIYNPVNIEKKLKKMGITVDDIEIIPNKEEVEEKYNIKLYHYLNKETGYIITSIYDNVNEKGYERLD